MKNRESDPYLGKRIGNYKIVAVLKSGAFGRVYKAEHIYLNRIVAMKLLPAANVHSLKEQNRFLDEAHILELLKHRHILPLFDFGIENGVPYLVVEYAPHGSLRDRLERQPNHQLPIEEAITILSHIGEALHYAHQHNIVHRDLKPENILFNERGEALLADFGIAMKQRATEFRHVSAGFGTPAYMAPEQFHGTISASSDQYALGCIAYELLTGHLPFNAADFWSFRHKHTQEPPIRPTHFNSQLSSALEQVILTALAKRPLARHADIQAFVRALQAAAVAQPQSFVQLRKMVLPAPERTREQLLEEGIRLRKLQLYEQAIATDELAIRLDPKGADAYNNKGTALYHLGHYDLALAAYDQAIRLAPHAAEPYNNKAITLYKLERYREALSLYDQALRYNPSLIKAHFCKGCTLLKLKQYQGALGVFEQAIRIDPSYADNYFGKGMALCCLKQYRQALAAFEQAIHLDPHFTQAYDEKAKVLRLLNRIEEAQRAHKKAKQLGYHG
jgi:tetratricopeptide (TPR) repeat protein